MLQGSVFRGLVLVRAIAYIGERFVADTEGFDLERSLELKRRSTC